MKKINYSQPEFPNQDSSGFFCSGCFENCGCINCNALRIEERVRVNNAIKRRKARDDYFKGRGGFREKVY